MSTALRNLTLFLKRWHNCAIATTMIVHVIFQTRKKNFKLICGIRQSSLGLANCTLVLSHSNAISVICLYVINLDFKTSGIKQALLPKLCPSSSILKKVCEEPFYFGGGCRYNDVFKAGHFPRKRPKILREFSENLKHNIWKCWELN